MEYTILQINDDSTALVEMTINGSTLNQNFPLGDSTDDLQASILLGMAQFQASLTANVQPDTSGYSDLVSQVQEVSDLPDIDTPIDQVESNLSQMEGRSRVSDSGQSVVA